MTSTENTEPVGITTADIEAPVEVAPEPTPEPEPAQPAGPLADAASSGDAQVQNILGRLAVVHSNGGDDSAIIAELAALGYAL